VKVEKVYICPICKGAFSSPATLFRHYKRHRTEHRLVLLTEFQSEVYDVCKKLAEEKGTFTSSEVVKLYRLKLHKRKTSEIKRALLSLYTKGLLSCVEVRKWGEFVWELKK